MESLECNEVMGDMKLEIEEVEEKKGKDFIRSLIVNCVNQCHARKCVCVKQCQHQFLEVAVTRLGRQFGVQFRPAGW